MAANFTHKLSVKGSRTAMCLASRRGSSSKSSTHTPTWFRTDRNTDTALSSVVNNLEKGTYLDQDTIAIFLDIAAAFDTICPGLIKRKLLEPVSYTHLTLPTIYSV